MKETILSNYTGDFAEKDSTGQHSRAAVTFHPVLSKARRRLRLHEKGGKEQEMPVHHLL